MMYNKYWRVIYYYIIFCLFENKLSDLGVDVRDLQKRWKKEEELCKIIKLYILIMGPNVVQKIGISYTSYKSCICRYVYCTFLNLLYLFVHFFSSLVLLFVIV